MIAAAKSAPPSPPPARTRGRRLPLIAGVIVGVLLILTALLYLNRRAATRQVLIGWLEQQGIEADMRVERLELDGLVASVRIGDADNPDVTVERVEVDYAIGGPWSKGGVGLTPTRIRLVRPVVRAGVRGGKLTLGSLDPLVERFTARPPRPDSRGPLVLVESGRVRLDTDYGPATLLGDARIDDGKLMRLTARMPATAFRSGKAEARGLRAAVDLTTTGDRVALRVAAAAEGAGLPGFIGEAAGLSLIGDLPYPDLETRRGDGRARIDLRLAAGRLAAGQTSARDADIHLSFDGQTAGWIETFRIDGVSAAELSAARIDGPDASASITRLRLADVRTLVARDPDGLGWRLDGAAAMTAARASGAGMDGVGAALTSSRLTVGGRGAAMEIEGPAVLSAARLAWDDLTLTGVRGAADFDLVSDNGLRVTASGAFDAARGTWPLFGAPTGDDVPELAAMKRALSEFAVEAPGFELIAGHSGTRLTLPRPVTLRPANGGVLTLNPVSTPVFAAPADRSAAGPCR